MKAHTVSIPFEDIVKMATKIARGGKELQENLLATVRKGKTDEVEMTKGMFTFAGGLALLAIPAVKEKLTSIEVEVKDGDYEYTVKGEDEAVKVYFVQLAVMVKGISNYGNEEETSDN